MNGRMGFFKGWAHLPIFTFLLPLRARNVYDTTTKSNIPSMQSMQIVYGAGLVLESI